ncbi:hypothetical protein Tco_0403852 [Tanacetum coccineum]
MFINLWADGIDSLNNQAIFDNIQLMGSVVLEEKESANKEVSTEAPEGTDKKNEGTDKQDGDQLVIVFVSALRANSHHPCVLFLHPTLIPLLKGRKYVKSFKGEPFAHKDPAFYDLDDIVDDTLDYIETEDAQDEGRISSVVLEEKENADKEVTTKAPVSTVKPNEGTNKKNEGTDKQDGGTDSTKVSTDRQAKKKFKQLANDEEMARKVQEEWEAEEEMKW